MSDSPGGGVGGGHRGGTAGAAGFRWTPFELQCLLDLEDQRRQGLGAATGFDAPRDSPTTTTTTPDSIDSPAGPGTSTAMWDNFETSAQAIASLYRNPTWTSFQRAAASTTQFYKDSLDNYNRGFEHGQLMGRQRTLKELVGFFKSSQGNKLYVRREDLLAWLCGKNRPTQSSRNANALPRSHPDHHAHPQLHRASTHDSGSHQYYPHRSNNTHHHHTMNTSADDLEATAIEMFHEALARTSGNNSPARSSPSSRRNTTGGGAPEHHLDSFLASELRRNRKRRRIGSPAGHQHYHNFDATAGATAVLPARRPSPTRAELSPNRLMDTEPAWPQPKRTRHNNH